MAGVALDQLHPLASTFSDLKVGWHLEESSDHFVFRDSQRSAGHAPSTAAGVQLRSDGGGFWR